MRNDWLHADYQRRVQLCKNYLGGKCALCGVENDLHFDHIDPRTKVYTITRNVNRRWRILVLELDKCQLLCSMHHKEKSKMNSEYGGGHNKWKEIKHGTLHAYTTYKCRCEICKECKRLYRISLRELRS